MRGQLQRAGVEAGRQLGIHAQLASGLLGTVAKFRVTHGLVPQHVSDGARGHPLQVLGHIGLHVGELGGLRGGLQHHQPGLPLGLQRDLVAHCRAGNLQICRHGNTGGPWVVLAKRLGLPLPAVKGGHDRPAEIQRRLGRDVGLGPFKPQTNGDPLVERDLGHVADLHRA
ncbi:hypothetical protein D3C71_1463590 [compost metagenome]